MSNNFELDPDEEERLRRLQDGYNWLGIDPSQTPSVSDVLVEGRVLDPLEGRSSEKDESSNTLPARKERVARYSFAQLLKSAVFENIVPEKKPQYEQKWITLETKSLGPRGLSFFSVIRDIFFAHQKNIAAAFKTSVLPYFGDGERFMDDLLLPYSNIFDQLLEKRSFSSRENSSCFLNVLNWLFLLNQSVTFPPINGQ